MKFFISILLITTLLSTACNNAQPSPQPENNLPSDTLAQAPATDTLTLEKDTIRRGTTYELEPESPQQAKDTYKSQATAPGKQDGVNNVFQAVTDLDPTIVLDIRYATSNNFTKAKIYDCPACLLRPAAAAALVKVHRALKGKGYGGLKMFDCYRPRPYQQRLWDKVPNANYVTPPAKGSMHSRGAAVDLTIIDRNGKELDMGTPYDFFGRAAHTDYTQLPANVLANRRLLQKEMEAAGFAGIRTEWWHFSFRQGNFSLSDYLWDCE